MSDERIAAGVERIERALARIAATANAGPITAPDDTRELDDLRARHAALRDEVAGALRELDEVLSRG